MRHMAAKFVPKMLTDVQKQNRVTLVPQFEKRIGKWFRLIHHWHVTYPNVTLGVLSRKLL